MRSRRQLQHGRTLPLQQPRQQHDRTIRKFQCVMVDVWILRVDLAEARDRRGLTHDRGAQMILMLGLAVERDLGAGQQADCGIQIPRSRETA